MASILAKFTHDQGRNNEQLKVKSRLLSAKDRLETFYKLKWPSNSPVDPKDLSEAGFFLTKKRKLPDQVECVFCRIKVANWVSGDDPLKEHSRINPRCDFIMGYQVGNIPLDGQQSSDPIIGLNPKLEREPDVCGHPLLLPQTHTITIPGSSQGSSSSSDNELSSSQSSTSSYGLSSPTSSLRNSFGPSLERHRPPCYPGYVTFSSRMKTYPDNWSDLCPVDAVSLSEAGFFYCGVITDGTTVIKDAVTCFHCNKKTCRWEPTDNAMVEHAKHSPNCYFIRLNFNEKMNEEYPSTQVELGHQLVGIGKQLSCIADQAHQESQEARCKICLDNEVQILFLPCKHATACVSCASSVSRCPTCRADISNSVRIYLS